MIDECKNYLEGNGRFFPVSIAETEENYANLI
jgi:hypothetical protein